MITGFARVGLILCLPALVSWSCQTRGARPAPDEQPAAGPSSVLAHYAYGGGGELGAIEDNLSGITWNPETGTYFLILNGERLLYEYGEDLSLVRTLNLTVARESRDLEDIVYVGRRGDDHEYALVNESGEILVGAIPDDDSTALDLNRFQLIVYAPPPAVSNRGGEGIAYDAASDRFWVCNEKSPMAIHTFVRPTGRDDYRYDENLDVRQPFDMEASLRGRATDVSACTFDNRTGRLLVLSDESQAVYEMETTGRVRGVLRVPGDGQEFEGLTLGPDQSLVIVGEPRSWARYVWTGS